MDFKITDNRTAYNREQWNGPNNTHENIAVHYIGVKNTDSPNLFHRDGSKGFGGHFYICFDGTIYQNADVNQVLWHVGASNCYTQLHPNGLTPTNYNTIGIEMSCYCDGKGDDPKDPTWYYTTAQQEALVWLCNYLMAKYNISASRVFRHGDIVNKWCPAPYMNNNAYKTNWTWNQFKMKLSEGNYMFSVKQVEKGMSGKDVRLVQMCLRGLGIKAAKKYGGNGELLDVDGNAGDNTDAAIRYFQELNKLKVDGKAGPATFNKLIQL